MKAYVIQYPPLSHLAFVLKQLLQERGLSNTYGGGLSSYCLVLMIVSFLQTSVQQKECERFIEKKLLGDILLRFLEFYGRRFAYQSTGISVMDAKHFALAADPRWCSHGPPPLVLVDPFDNSSNIAVSAFGMHRVRAAFDFSYAVLTRAADSVATDNSALSLVLRTWTDKGKNWTVPSPLGRDTTPDPHRANFTS